MVHEVRRAGAGEAGALAHTLAQAFQGDPVMRWMFSDPQLRSSLLEPAFRLYLERLWLPHEETYAAGGTAGSPPGSRPAPGSWGSASSCGYCRRWRGSSVAACPAP